MDKREGLRAGIAEMRSVAQRLNQWADDLEEGSADQAGAEPEAAPEKGKTLTIPEVRAVLAGKCAEGFGAQVKALIGSYGAASLKGVPAEKYGELLEAAGRLGAEGGDADAG
jgi:hypothetical protein